jgi:tetratricopeptide (TPR) repeat protein
MKSALRLPAALFLGLAVIASTAIAGTQGRITGKVTDSAGNPLEGVNVTLTTAAIKNFKVTTKTSKDGRYGSIVNDATINYHMRFEKDGYVAADLDKKFSTIEITTVDQKLVKQGEAGTPGAARAAAAAAPAGPSPSGQAAVAYNEAVDLLNAGDKAGAEAKFLEAVGKNPDLPQGWNALASISYDKKDWAKVLQYGEKATDLDPSLTNLYGLMADAAAKTGDKAKAAEMRKKFEEANPDTPEMLYNKGIDAYNKRNSKQAEEYLEKAVTAKPDFALAHYYLGLAAMNNKKNAVAREHLQKYLDLEPNGSEAATAKELLPLVK